MTTRMMASAGRRGSGEKCKGGINDETNNNIDFYSGRNKPVVVCGDDCLLGESAV